MPRPTSLSTDWGRHFIRFTAGTMVSSRLAARVRTWHHTSNENVHGLVVPPPHYLRQQPQTPLPMSLSLVITDQQQAVMEGSDTLPTRPAYRSTATLSEPCSSRASLSSELSEELTHPNALTTLSSSLMLLLSNSRHLLARRRAAMMSQGGRHE